MICNKYFEGLFFCLEMELTVQVFNSSNTQRQSKHAKIILKSNMYSNIVQFLRYFPAKHVCMYVCCACLSMSILHISR